MLGPRHNKILSRVFGLLTRDLSKVHGHSIREPDVSPQQRSYPVLIMRAGASAPVMNYSIYDRLPADGSVRIAIRGANHFTFSEDGALLKSRVMRGAFRLFGKLGIDGRRQIACTVYAVHTFFDAYLKGAGASRPNISSPLYPEIQVLD